MRIYSEVGEGTTVCLYLPRHYGEADEDEVARRLAEVGQAGQGETVPIVDDELLVRMLFTEVLEDLGYTVIETADSVAGLKVLQSEVRIDLLFTDVGLPEGMNGRQMADAGRERHPDLKVLFITGYLRPGMQVLTKLFCWRRWRPASRTSSPNSVNEPVESGSNSRSRHRYRDHTGSRPLPLGPVQGLVGLPRRITP